MLNAVFVSGIRVLRIMLDGAWKAHLGVERVLAQVLGKRPRKNGARWRV